MTLYTIYIAPQALDRPDLIPARWWRDDADRYRARSELASTRRRFNASELPAEARNPEWERMAAEYVYVRPIEFERIDPDPIADIRIRFDINKIVEPEPYFKLLGTEDL